MGMGMGMDMLMDMGMGMGVDMGMDVGPGRASWLLSAWSARKGSEQNDTVHSKVKSVVQHSNQYSTASSSTVKQSVVQQAVVG